MQEGPGAIRARPTCIASLLGVDGCVSPTVTARAFCSLDLVSSLPVDCQMAQKPLIRRLDLGPLRHVSAVRVEMGRVLASHVRATVVALGAVSALVLTGCSDGAGAQPGPSKSGPRSSTTTASPTPSSTATTTASPSGTATVAVPAAARAHTEEGAKAFAKFYFETASEAARSASSTRLKALSRPDCGGCTAFVDLVEGYQAQKQHIDRDAMKVTAVNIRPGDTKSVVGVDVLATDGPKTLVDGNGATVKKFPQSKLFFETTTEWDGLRWTMRELRVVQ